jgi:hypothetical protein
MSQEKNEIMQKQLEALSFLDKRKATKPKLMADEVPSVSGVTLGSDQVTGLVQQQISGDHASFSCRIASEDNVMLSPLMKYGPRLWCNTLDKFL